MTPSRRAHGQVGAFTAIVRALEGAGVQFGADGSVRLGSDRQ